MRLVWLPAVLLIVAGCVAVTPNDDTTAPPIAFEALNLETDQGTITAILYASEAPLTVEFIKRLVTSGYYDGREFNRIIPGFVIQEVDRAGGATDQTETVPLEAGTDAMFSAGAFGIARNEDPDSGGSEFFVMDFAHSHLYRNYTVFAQVIVGLDIVHKIARVDAIETGPIQTLPVATPVHDRVAVQPPKIVRASIISMEIPGDIAANYPLQVGERTVADGARYTPEWPANLRAGGTSLLTWYVYTSPSGPMPDLADARAIVVAPNGSSETFTFAPDKADARILHWTWTPTEAGNHTLQLMRGPKVVAENVIMVAR